MAVQIFDRVDPNTLDRRELNLWILAYSIILILAVGVGLLMYPTVFSHPLSLGEMPSRMAFFGFCGLAALAVGYFVDRQVVIRHLRTELEAEKTHISAIRREASSNLLTNLPGLNVFRDRLAMEYRRALTTHQPLSLLTVDLKPSRDLNISGETETTFGDAAKTLMRKLRGEDSLYLFAPGVFGILLPSVSTGGANIVRDRLMEGLHDAAGVSDRFSFGITVLNFPEHVDTAREMEESVQSILPQNANRDSNFELVTPSVGIQ
jgi:GGDEF domain-containing protein